MTDIFAAVRDSALNGAIRFLMTWRPDLFNYVAPSQHANIDANGHFIGIVDNWLTCVPVNLPPGVDPNTYPRYSRRPPLHIKEVPGGGIPYCVQITDFRIDFQPSEQVTLPPELTPPLAAQQFALWGKASAGIGCPPDDLIDALLRLRFVRRARQSVLEQITLEVQQLICFSLEIFVTGHLYTEAVPVAGSTPITQIRVALDGIEIKDLAPVGLEDALECYIRLLIRGYVLPELVLALEPIIINTLDYTKALAVTATITPTLTGGLPHNPAIEENELRVWLDVDIK